MKNAIPNIISNLRTKKRCAVRSSSLFIHLDTISNIIHKTRLFSLSRKNKKMKNLILNLISTRISAKKCAARASSLLINFHPKFIFWIIPNKEPDPSCWARLLEYLTSFLERSKTYFTLWSFEQWASSLICLVILYLVAGYFYNKWLEKTIRGKWLDIPARLKLIGFDLAVNFSLGIYYMNHRETLIGQIMVTCPIAISPLIFIVELICVTIYYYYVSTPGVVKFWEMMGQKPYGKKLKFLWRCWQRYRAGKWPRRKDR